MGKHDFKYFIMRGLRRMSYKWPPRNECLKRARKDRNTYLCNICKNLFPYKSIQLDHVEPVIDTSTGFVDWNTYLPRMFVEVEGYQVLCIQCHDKKTKEEMEKRKLTRRKQKGKI